jgi:hypothetical protein
MGLDTINQVGEGDDFAHGKVHRELDAHFLLNGVNLELFGHILSGMDGDQTANLCGPGPVFNRLMPQGNARCPRLPDRERRNHHQIMHIRQCKTICE